MKTKYFFHFLLLCTFFNETLYAQFFSATEIYKKCVDAVVLISTPFGIGTGFFINEQGYIITNHHVIQDNYGYTLKPKSISIQMKNGSTFQVISVDDTPDFPGLDIAILKIDAKISTYLSIKENEVLVGEDVVAIGHPNRDFWNQSKGIISKISLNDKYLLQHDVPTDEGNSGGPLINGKGLVVGVVTAYKKMIDNEGNTKIQETGKLATKSIWIKNLLDKRKIKYYQRGIVIEGMNEVERQFNDLLKDRELLNNDREKLRKERESLDYERRKLEKEILDFEIKKQTSKEIIENAEKIKKEIDERKRSLEKKLKELDSRKSDLEERERWLIEKEEEINKKIAKKLAIEVMIIPNYLYFQNQDCHYLITRGTIGLFYKFGIERDFYNKVISSDRVGIIYGVQKLLSIKEPTFNDEYNQDFSLVIEFDEIFRLGIGKNIRNEYLFLDNKDYNFIYILININDYPFSYGFNLAYYTDNKFSMKNYCIGLFAGINLSFFRW
ncbi:serine protease [Bacteroidetes/Chlorobi group bacterium ChocPot_Mid]|jgi:hypothetical protein|nr:MAG: serine protease [Bacteroidetes/Chlorobi group bacterium ChocPot_Mid]